MKEKKDNSKTKKDISVSQNLLYNQYFLIFLLFMFFFISCNKEYKYFEKSEEIGIVGVKSIKEKEHIIIKAKDDTSAYIEAYTRFCASEKVYQEMSKSLRNPYWSRPYSFRLLNSNNQDITYIFFDTKDKIENEIRESFLSL